MNDMNASFLKPSAMPDVQSTRDERALPIEQVGIRGVRHPLTIRTKAGSFPSVGNFEMDVALPAHIKGTHMSRFMAILQKQEEAIDSTSVVLMVREMLPLLDAAEGRVQFTYTHFVKKAAPVSGVESLMDYEVTWMAKGKQNATGSIDVELQLSAVVPVMSLCPCSKEISDFGAHNHDSIGYHYHAHTTTSTATSGSKSYSFTVRYLIKGAYAGAINSIPGCVVASQC